MDPNKADLVTIFPGQMGPPVSFCRRADTPVGICSCALQQQECGLPRSISTLLWYPSCFFSSWFPTDKYKAVYKSVSPWKHPRMLEKLHIYLELFSSQWRNCISRGIPFRVVLIQSEWNHFFYLQSEWSHFFYLLTCFFLFLSISLSPFFYFFWWSNGVL